MNISRRNVEIMAATNDIVIFQYQYIIRNRNSRLVISIACFFVTVYLFLVITRTPKQMELSYDPSKDPVAIKLGKLEGKVDSFLSFFTQLLNYKNDQKNRRIISTSKSKFMDSFWYKNETSNSFYEHIFNSSSKPSNHSSHLISTTKCSEKTPVLILVISHPKDFDRRRIIRQTWGSGFASYQKGQWKTYFLLGKHSNEQIISQLIDEQTKHGDLIFGDIEEDSSLIAQKVHMGFEWSVKYCAYDYVIKTDDKAFINMCSLFKHLQADDTPKKELYFGNVQYETKVMRDGPYSLGHSEYSKVVFPRYCASGGYVLSKDAVEKILPLFLKTDPLKFDDIYVGILALKSGIDPTHSNEFQMFRDEKKCEYNRHGIILHPVVREDCMVDLFKESLKRID